MLVARLRLEPIELSSVSAHLVAAPRPEFPFWLRSAKPQLLLASYPTGNLKTCNGRPVALEVDSSLKLSAWSVYGALQFHIHEIADPTLLPRPGPTLVTVQPDEVWGRFLQGGEFIAFVDTFASLVADACLSLTSSLSSRNTARRAGTRPTFARSTIAVPQAARRL